MYMRSDNLAKAFEQAVRSLQPDLLETDGEAAFATCGPCIPLALAGQEIPILLRCTNDNINALAKTYRSVDGDPKGSWELKVATSDGYSVETSVSLSRTECTVRIASFDVECEIACSLNSGEADKLWWLCELATMVQSALARHKCKMERYIAICSKLLGGGLSAELTRKRTRCTQVLEDCLRQTPWTSLTLRGWDSDGREEEAADEAEPDVDDEADDS